MTALPPEHRLPSRTVKATQHGPPFSLRQRVRTGPKTPVTVPGRPSWLPVNYPCANVSVNEARAAGPQGSWAWPELDLTCCWHSIVNME